MALEITKYSPFCIGREGRINSSIQTGVAFWDPDKVFNNECEQNTLLRSFSTYKQDQLAELRVLSVEAERYVHCL